MRAWRVRGHTFAVVPALSRDPVRRGLSTLSRLSLEYWIARSSRAKTTDRDMEMQGSGTSCRENAGARALSINANHKPARHRQRMRVIQYSRDAGAGIEKPRRTGYSACAGYDGCESWRQLSIFPVFAVHPLVASRILLLAERVARVDAAINDAPGRGRHALCVALVGTVARNSPSRHPGCSRGRAAAGAEPAVEPTPTAVKASIANITLRMIVFLALAKTAVASLST